MAALLLVLAGLSPAWGEFAEIEPNNTCATAQVVGAVAIPSSHSGQLTPPSGSQTDVDFFRFTAEPNRMVIVGLRRADTPQGLGDPFLVLFNSSCQQIGEDDDGGEGLNSSLAFVVPGDGVFIVAVSACCTLVDGGVGDYVLSLDPGGIISGAIRDSADGVVNPSFVRAFTPGGLLAGRATVTTGTPTTYELGLPTGTYRVVAEGLGSRTWYANQNSFSQATDIAVGIDQRITGIDLILAGRVQLAPTLNQPTFKAGDTLRLNLAARNPSASAASVVIAAEGVVPAEPGIPRSAFCCFSNVIGLLPATDLTLGAGESTVIENVVTYVFTGSEQPGPYTACATVIQGGVSTERCLGFTVGPAQADEQSGPVLPAPKKKRP